MKTLGKYSMGLGDRFGQQGTPQLKAIIVASQKGIDITPVWNKSNREHNLIGTQPADVRTEADTVTKNAGYNKPYFVDADHINLESVDRFIGASDFFTIDVANYIGRKADENEITEFLSYARKYVRDFKIPGTKLSFNVSGKQVSQVAEKYLFAAIRTREVYSKIEKIKGKCNFITEVSMDEVTNPQTPVEFFFILMMLGYENVPFQTIAPKFSGRFNKGVDYVGDPVLFSKEFESDLLIIDFAVKEFGLPEDLKMSIHSGSDKFSIYPYLGSIIEKHNKGIHVKTAGTSWLEEIIGLAKSGGEALDFVKELYLKALEDIEELIAPYADVIDIDVSALPTQLEITAWTGKKFSDALRHDSQSTDYNPDMRQLIHVAYKLAALKITDYFRLLKSHEDVISECVYDNLYNRHICKLFRIE
jgi:tagaturonate epimerase